ncbi:unnamed protein product [Pseudo-nitzschia multistriata]|uniref:RNA helicase n=1 Tax=Pseudo-nitzschia multistriata TaxID=183589 RepID=A0A448ZC67_9STRA|nr:unnamed protein product [Pseudo-nitzschia multistriata]
MARSRSRRPRCLVFYGFCGGLVGAKWFLAANVAPPEPVSGLVDDTGLLHHRTRPPRMRTRTRMPTPASLALSAGPIPSATPGIDLEERLVRVLGAEGESEAGSGSESSLPVFGVLDSVRESLSTKPNLLLQAAPGAGKTTIVPLRLLLDALRGGSETGSILVVAPRRVAVRSAAQRMASLLGEGGPGGTVGYSVRDDSVFSKEHTRIRVVTDGVLLSMLRKDPLLEGISVVVLDEFHERGVGSDTCLALLREVQQTVRPDDLGIVVMSATLLGNVDEAGDGDCNGDGDGARVPSTGSKLVATLGGTSACGIVESDGRQYPIRLLWANQVAKAMSLSPGGGRGRTSIPPLGALLRDRKLLVRTVSDVVEHAALQQAPGSGDVLVFMPGVAECKGVVRELSSRTSFAGSSDVLALYGAMPRDEQERVLYPPESSGAGIRRRQRVIVSTPVAEASLTIPGVTCVVDSGLRREPRCDSDTGMSRLVSALVSRASAVQRAGRAGRVGEGCCLRLYTENDFATLFAEQSPPEISSTDLAPILLLLSDWGASTVSEILEDMPFVDPPDKASLERAERFLVEIGALEHKEATSRNGKNSSSNNSSSSNRRFVLTDLGRTISKMPCHPRLATAIAAAGNTGETAVLAASIAAAFCLDDESSSPPSARDGDDPNLAHRVRFLVRSRFPALKRFAGKTSGRRGEQAVEALRENEDGFLDGAVSCLGRALLPGFVDLVGERKGDAAYESSNYLLALGKSCRLGFRKSPPYVLAVETNTGPDGISRMRSYVPLSRDLLEGIATEEELLYTVPSKGHQVRAKLVRSVGRIELSSSPLPSPSPDKVAEALLRAMAEHRGGIAGSLLVFLAPKEQSMVEELVSRIRLDRELTGADDWPPCFEALDGAGGSSGNTDDSDELDGHRVLMDLVEPWLGSVKSLKELNTLDILRSTLSPEQQRYLDDYYPTFVDAPDGSRVPVRYVRTSDEQPASGSASGGGGEDGNSARTTNCRPVATAKLQQFFGARDPLVIGPPQKAMVPLTLSLVSPAGKPLAETGDLPFFWREVYPSIRSEMRGKYPKHPWPENPLEAVATRKTKKQLSREESAAGDGSGTTDQKGGKKKRKRKKK